MRRFQIRCFRLPLDLPVGRPKRGGLEQPTGGYTLAFSVPRHGHAAITELHGDFRLNFANGVAEGVSAFPTAVIESLNELANIVDQLLSRFDKVVINEVERKIEAFLGRQDVNRA